MYLNVNAIVTFACVIFGAFLMVSSKTGPSHDKIVVCYISTWAVYRPGRGSFALENIDPNLCTHVVYAFAGLNASSDSIRSLDPWQDLKDDYGKGGFERITKMRETYPHLKISLAVGGWNEGSKNYSSLMAEPARRQRFVKSATDFIRRYKFDGLDLDWEYPTQRGGEPFDRQNFVSLTKELRDSFRPYNLLLTSAFGASKKVIDEAYDIPQLSKYLDFLHIMCYDYGGAWDKRITANAPLKSTDMLNVEYTIDYLIKLGAPPAKIVLGLPLYGRTFITNNNDGNFGDPSNDYGFQGNFTRENGFMGYNEVCLLLSNPQSGWIRSWDAATNEGVARWKNAATGEMRVVVYDSTRSVANKVRFAMQWKLAGLMVWSVDTDDFHGDCDIDEDTYSDFKPAAGIKLDFPKRYNANYPLMRTINEATVLALDEIAQETEIINNQPDNEIPHGDDEDGKGAAHHFTLNNLLSLFALALTGVHLAITRRQ